MKQNQRKLSAGAGTVAGVIAVGCRRSPSKKKKPQETRLCWLSSSQNRLEFCLGLFSLLVLSRLAKFLSNSSNSKASCGYRSVSVSAITELHILVFPSVTTKQS